MTKVQYQRIYANDKLREALIAQNDFQKDGNHGYIKYTAKVLAQRMPELASQVTDLHRWLQILLASHKPCPTRWAIALVRLAEDDTNLPREDARRLLARYFDTE